MPVVFSSDPHLVKPEVRLKNFIQILIKVPTQPRQKVYQKTERLGSWSLRTSHPAPRGHIHFSFTKRLDNVDKRTNFVSDNFSFEFPSKCCQLFENAEIITVQEAMLQIYK